MTKTGCKVSHGCGFLDTCFPLLSSQRQHLAYDLLHADRIRVASIEPALVLLDRPRLQAKHLYRRLDHSHSRLELVGGIADESALLHEGVFEIFENRLQGARERP